MNKKRINLKRSYQIYFKDSLKKSQKTEKKANYNRQISAASNK